MNRLLASDLDRPHCLDVITYAYDNLRNEDPILQFMVDTYFLESAMMVSMRQQ
jgi:hypothetical protein